MSLLTYTDLLALARAGILENVSTDRINAASIDIRLGDELLIENRRGKLVDLSKKEAPPMQPAPLQNGAWHLRPGEFALASSIEVFHLPDDIACEFKLKSSHARAGLDHALAGWADPGFHNATLTLELRNTLQHSTLLLRPGQAIGQLVFWRGAVVPAAASYRQRGRYNGQRSPQPSKEVVR